MNQFKQGDRVSVSGQWEGRVFDKTMGTVLGAYTESLLVEFDNFISGHDGRGPHGKDGHCWYLPKDFATRMNRASDGFSRRMDKKIMPISEFTARLLKKGVKCASTF